MTRTEIHAERAELYAVFDAVSEEFNAASSQAFKWSMGAMLVVFASAVTYRLTGDVACGYVGLPLAFASVLYFKLASHFADRAYHDACDPAWARLNELDRMLAERSYDETNG